MEACIDVAQHIISDEDLREPTACRDTFCVLAEHGILPSQDRPRFEAMASFRNLIVHYYERVDEAFVYSVLRNHLSEFELFIDRVVDYLRKVNDEQGL